jgi:DNA-binding response OmpR family regulator
MESHIKEYCGIILVPLRKEMYIRQKRISLTDFESIFIDYLIECNGYCNLESFSNHLSKSCKKNGCKRCLVVYINRLRRKIYYQTGEKIIKCKYSFGYFIDS